MMRALSHAYVTLLFDAVDAAADDMPLPLLRGHAAISPALYAILR